MNLKEIDYNCLNSFFQLVTHRSFEKVSRIMGVSQLTLRRRLKKLEDELGVTLLASKSGFITCTKEADDLYMNLKILFDNIHDIKRKHDDNTYRIGFATYIGELFLKCKLEQLIAKLGVKVEFYIESLEELVMKLNNNQIDMVFGFNQFFYEKKLEFVQLENLNMVLVRKKNSEFKPISECILIDPNISFLSNVILACEEMGIEEKINIVGNNKLMLMESGINDDVCVLIAPTGIFDENNFCIQNISYTHIFPLRTQLIYRKDYIQKIKFNKLLNFFKSNLIIYTNNIINEKLEFYQK